MREYDPEVIPVRDEERLDTARLEPYLREHLTGVSGAFALAQFGGGHANLTYLVRFGEDEFVVRRPPLGPVAPHAHDMQREHRVLSVLYAAFPLAPRSLHLCTDHAIIGSDFLVEERKYGIAIRRDLPERFRGDATLARRIGEMLVDTLATLHRVDVKAVGLDTLGKPQGYTQRQLDGWQERWERAATASTHDAGALIHWLREHLPPPGPATLIHNDFKLDNMLVAADDPARATALLDWDMCTLGDPLMDLGYLLALWAEPGDPQAWRVHAMPTWHAGFPTRHEVARRYAQQTGFDITHLSWYHVFSIFRFAAILQQIYARFERGQTHDQRFRHFGEQANALVVAAAALSAAIPSVVDRSGD